MTACFLISLLLAVPFLFFMTLFTPWLIEGLPMDGMPGGDASWFAAQAWAAGEFWPIVAMVTTFALYESAYRTLRLEPRAFLGPGR